MNNLNCIKLKFIPKVFLTIIITMIINSNTVHAEYRVYQYYVKSTFASPKDGSNYLVTSTLDPVTYVTYHGGANSLKVDLLRTWTCEGYTGKQNQVCDSPLAQGKVERGTASEGVGL